MSIRPYQQAAIDAARAALEKSGSAIMQMPTGAGKTKSATEVVRTSDGPVWFVCHRQEIERQVARAFTEAGIEFGIVSPRGAPEYDKRVQIVSVHTLRRRIADLPQPALVVWDECHHVAAKTWAALREQLSGAKHLGLTATPERLDGKGLREWFDDLIVGPSIEQLIADGWLSPARYFAPSDPDLTAAKLQAGDYAKKDADAVMNTPVLIGDAVAEYKRNAASKRALAFCTSVAASEALVARFNAEGIPAQHVDGNTPDDARSAAIAALADGRVKVLSNVEVFTEGFDVPGIDAVILMRPTKSPTLLLQMIGRALRVSPGKSEAIIMDHAGLHRDHGWFADNWHWELDGGAAKARRRAVERGPRKCPECHEVRADRVPVCACGYEFPTGREVGEFDGVLNEIRGVVPEGCETRRAFANRFKVDDSTVLRWMKLGMPVNGPSIPIDSAVAWLADGGHLERLEKQRSFLFPPSGCVSRSKFAQLIGASAAVVRTYQRQGMPSKGTAVRVEAAKAWLASNQAGPPDGHESQKDFGDRVGKSHGAIHALIKAGLPANDKGYVHIEAALAWMRRNRDAAIPPSEFARRMGAKPWEAASWAADGMPKISQQLVNAEEAEEWLRQSRFFPSLCARNNREGYETVELFASRFSVSTHVVLAWKRKGMPIEDGVRPFAVPIISASAWVENNVNMARTQKLRTAHINSDGLFENIASFSRRTGAAYHAIQPAIKRGLPYDPKKGIPIQAGLEWVRDNRPDIVIPPEAWPEAPEPDRNAA